MDMADYSEALDPAYTTLEFENMQVLPLGTGECTAPLDAHTFTAGWFWSGSALKKRGSPVGSSSGFRTFPLGLKTENSFSVSDTCLGFHSPTTLPRSDF